MSHNVYTFYVCETHEDIFGLQSPNMNYQCKCGGVQHCGWEDEAGYLILDGDNKLIQFYLSDWVISNIRRGNYSFNEKSVLYNLYDLNDNPVEVTCIADNIKF